LVEKIVSGGQTGVDRAALDFALDVGLACGGWCPQGRLSEDGAIEARYPLLETPSADYSVRTRQNVLDSDGTMILNIGALTGGTAHTVRCAQDLERPYIVIQLEQVVNPESVVQWLNREEVRVLNVAGPRASKEPRVYELARRFLEALFPQT